MVYRRAEVGISRVCLPGMVSVLPVQRRGWLARRLLSAVGIAGFRPGLVVDLTMTWRREREKGAVVRIAPRA